MAIMTTRDVRKKTYPAPVYEYNYVLVEARRSCSRGEQKASVFRSQRLELT